MLTVRNKSVTAKKTKTQHSYRPGPWANPIQKKIMPGKQPLDVPSLCPPPGTGKQFRACRHEAWEHRAPPFLGSLCLQTMDTLHNG